MHTFRGVVVVYVAKHAMWFSLLAMMIFSGCASLTGHGGQIETRSATQPTALKGTLRTAVHAEGTASQAEIYLSDLPADQLRAWIDPGTLSGQIIHISVLITPRAGRTPVDEQACTAAIRQIIFARGEWGVYAGGGFVDLKGTPGARQISGSLRNATLKFQGGTPGFVDRLGSSTMQGTFAAMHDRPAAQQLGGRLEQAALVAKTPSP